MVNFNKKGALIPLIQNLLWISAVSFFMMMALYYAVIAENPNSPSASQLQNYTLELNKSLGRFTTQADSAYDALGNRSSSTPSASFLFLIFENAFWIPISFLGLVGSSIRTLGSILFPSLGGGAGIIASIAISLIGATILIAVVLAIIKAIRTGESER